MRPVQLPGHLAVFRVKHVRPKSVVHQNVDLSESFQHVIDQYRNGLAVSHVCLESRCIAAGLSARGYHRFCSIRTLQVVHGDRSAFGGECLCNGSANTAAGAGDENDFVGEIHCITCSASWVCSGVQSA